MWLKCDYCGKEYRTYTSPRCKNHYCSKECTHKARDTKQLVRCGCCGAEIYRLIDKTNPNKHYFCSNACLNKWQGRNKIEFVCKICGKRFYRSPSWIKQKRGYYCSMACRNADEQWKMNACTKGNMIQCKKKGLNKLELMGNEILNALKLEYQTQCLINDKICVDVYIPKHNLIIQWDGDYWHGKDIPYDEMDDRVKHRVSLDKSQDAYFKKCGFNELRFWESDVKYRKDLVYANISRSIQQITK